VIEKQNRMTAVERLDISIRRQILKDDEMMIGQPVDTITSNPRAIQAHVRHMALMLLDTAVTDRASRAAAYAEDLIDITMARQVTQPIACAKGCSHCCTTYVSTSLPEVFRLAQAVRGNADMIARVAAASARAQAMPQMQREVDRVICPILEDHACAAYLNRPIVCRAVLSTSLDSCVKFFQQNSSGAAFAFPDQLSAVRAFMTVIFRAALVLGGLPYQNYELTHALDIALRAEDTEARWLAGEPLFAAVSMDRGEQQSGQLMGLVNALVNAVRPTI
jgi:hypothetical protein